MTNTATAFFQTLGSGLWVLVPQFALTLVLLAIGVAVYLWITPFDERGMVERGNLAGGVTLGGTVLALSIPLAATLATSHALIDIAVWGVVALILQLVAFAVATLLLHGLRRNIEAGNVAAAVTLIGIQIAVALVNAAAVAG
jgi:putative membrane protein